VGEGGGERVYWKKKKMPGTGEKMVIHDLVCRRKGRTKDIRYLVPRRGEGRREQSEGGTKKKAGSSYSEGKEKLK